MDMRSENCNEKKDSDPRDTSEQRAPRDQEEHCGIYRINLQVYVHLLTLQ